MIEYKNLGWVCPICQNPVSPFSLICPHCSDMKVVGHVNTSNNITDRMFHSGGTDEEQVNPPTYDGMDARELLHNEGFPIQPMEAL